MNTLDASYAAYVPTEFRSSNKARKKILIVDDEDLIRYSLAKFLDQQGFATLTADSGLSAIKTIERENPDTVILDIYLPDADGLALLKTIKETSPHTRVIVITGCADIRTSVEAMKQGAVDYLEKPIDLENLKTLVSASREERHPSPSAAAPLLREEFVYRSEAMAEIVRIMERLSNKSDVTVLVLGESGTGKSLLCKIMHELSPRAKKPFVEIGCSNIPEHLIESELFGYEKGAFTDAKAQKKGLVEMADGGSAFFDEIGDMPYPMQSKILSLMEEKKYRRIGGLQALHADVRIFAATNRNLFDLVQAKKFRLDLYYRLNIVTIEMPPLRTRQADIAPLVEHYLARYCAKHSCTPKGITPRVLSVLEGYSWPGNVRELKNMIEKLVIFSQCETIDLPDLSANLLSGNAAPAGSEEEQDAPAARSRTLSLRVMEEDFIRAALRLAAGNQRKAAKLLEISRDTLRYRLKKLKIDSSEFQSS